MSIVMRTITYAACMIVIMLSAYSTSAVAAAAVAVSGDLNLSSGSLVFPDSTVQGTSAVVSTPIASLPFDINSSGPYHLTANLSSTGNGINLNADDVTIDFKGFTITGPGTQSSFDGISSNMAFRRNIEIRNGTIVNFADGIDAKINYGRVINMRAHDNGYDGILLKGSNNHVLNCSSYSNSGHGIVTGTGSLISGNIANNNAGVGIYGYDYSTIKNNIAFYNGQTGILPGNNSLVDGNTSGGQTPNIGPCATCTFGLNHAPL